MRARSRLIFAVAPPVAAAALGGLAARDAPEIYRRLDKPGWAPPASAYGPIWSVLYALIGAAGWRSTKRANALAMTLHLAQLALNASWTPLFFGAGRRRAALATVVLLDATVAAEIAVLARDGDRVAALLLAPYLGWSGVATALTASVGDPGPRTT